MARLVLQRSEEANTDRLAGAGVDVAALDGAVTPRGRRIAEAIAKRAAIDIRFAGVPNTVSTGGQSQCQQEEDSIHEEADYRWQVEAVQGELRRLKNGREGGEPAPERPRGGSESAKPPSNRTRFLRSCEFVTVGGTRAGWAGAADEASLSRLARGWYAGRVRAVVQRVARAEVRVGPDVVGRIGAGLLVLLGAGLEDTEADVDYLVDKIAGLRIFADPAGNMNLSLSEVGGSLLVVSQFTLYGDARKGRRPSFSKAMPPAGAEALYERFCAAARTAGFSVQTGRFRTTMQVESVNDGPVTILLDSRRLF